MDKRKEKYKCFKGMGVMEVASLIFEQNEQSIRELADAINNERDYSILGEVVDPTQEQPKISPFGPAKTVYIVVIGHRVKEKELSIFLLIGEDKLDFYPAIRILMRRKKLLKRNKG